MSPRVYLSALPHPSLAKGLRLLVSRLQADELLATAADIRMSRPRPRPIGRADAIEAERREQSEHIRPGGNRSRGVADFEQVGIEFDDLIAEPSRAADREGVGMDEPAGDPPEVVAVVVENGTRHVGPAKDGIEPTAEQAGHRVQGRRMGPRPEEQSGRRDKLPGRRVELLARVSPRVVGRLRPPETDDRDLEEGEQVVEVGLGQILTRRGPIKTEPEPDLRRDRADLLGRRLLAQGDLDRRALAASDRPCGDPVGEGGEPRAFIEAEVNLLSFAPANRCEEGASAPTLRQRRDPFGQTFSRCVAPAHDVV
jgi:hypothetical protein